MPLQAGKSKEAFSHNVEVEVNAGKPQKQAVAIAYSKQREAKDADPEVSLDDVRQHIRMHQAIEAFALECIEEQGATDCEVEMDGELPPVTAHDHSPVMAFDRSLRTKDLDGRLHVRDCRISKANICPYLGREIPDADALGLEADRVYNLYRDAAALSAAAPSFERIPLMIVHAASTADQPRKEKIIGAVSNARWEPPYLVADLTVWDQEGIDAIESEKQRELSPGYRYRPEMNSGVVDGESYDGRMLDIVANHLAIVDTGRTGPDVLVNDSRP